MRSWFGLAAVLLAASITARADVVTDWAATTTEIATDGPNTVRTMALAQSAVYEAINAITSRYPRDRVDLGAAPGASIEAAVAAASRSVLLHEAPALSKQTEAAYTKALGAIADNQARTNGVRLGERAAADVIGKHTGDIGQIEPYRPVTTPGMYVPTTFPLGYAVAQHHPWFMKNAEQFRPGPPPSLKSATWAHDYNETRTLGSATSQTRTIEQTDIARFWASSLPDIYINVVKSFATASKREITRNARLYAAITAAMNDAEIAQLETKYHYQFWRPITAIRNGDRDDNAQTERDPDWNPLTATPMQPEYPCGNCVIASAVIALIRADAGHEPLPVLSTVSNTAPGETRRWTHPEEMIKEVALARICAGVHYRNSTEVGNKMGEQVGALIASAYGLAAK